MGQKGLGLCIQIGTWRFQGRKPAPDTSPEVLVSETPSRGSPWERCQVTPKPPPPALPPPTSPPFSLPRRLLPGGARPLPRVGGLGRNTDWVGPSQGPRSIWRPSLLLLPQQLLKRQVEGSIPSVAACPTLSLSVPSSPLEHRPRAPGESQPWGPRAGRAFISLGDRVAT